MVETKNSWHSYSKVFNLGHPQIRGLLKGIVLIEEKIDGSQFSFGVHNGELKMKSRRKELFYPVTDKLFKDAVETVNSLHKKGKLIEGWTYRGEVVSRPKHNSLEYEETPNGNIVLFDIETGYCEFASLSEKIEEASRLGLTPVNIIYIGYGEKVTEELFDDFLKSNSILGGGKIEGVVIKNYNLFTRDGKVAMGKYVNSEFRETQKADWKKQNPSNVDIIDFLVSKYKTSARWEKAVQHLKEDGKLKDENSDIGLLIKEVQSDVIEDCAEQIKEDLFGWAWKKMKNRFADGLPEWYKEKLLEKQFDQ